MTAASTWAKRFKAWVDYANQTRDRAERIDRARRQRGWALAASVGIPRCGCSLHNASIDDKMTGWCYGNPERLQAAKVAAKWTSEYRAGAMASLMIDAAYQRMVMQPEREAA